MDPALQVIGIVSVDYAALSRDVQELLEAFALSGCTQLSQMKEIWRSRGFSFIHEARPVKLEPSRFMQILFSSTLVYLSPTRSLPWRLGALYALYILYETQEYTPRVKIYLSLENLDWLLSLVKEVKQGSDPVPLKVVRHLVREKAFLYGHTSLTHNAVEEAAERRMRQVDIRLRQARSKLLSNVNADEHLFGNLARSLEMDEKSELAFQEYNHAKQSIFQRVNGQQEQENQITIREDIEKLSKERDELRAAYLAERSKQPETPSEGSFFSENTPEIDFDFGDDLNDMAEQLDMLLG